MAGIQTCRSTLRLLPPVKLTANQMAAYMKARKSTDPNIRAIRIGSRPLVATSICGQTVSYYISYLDLDNSGIAEKIWINHRTRFTPIAKRCNKLVPTLFVTIYDIRRLEHLPRYIQAAAIRARRAVVDFEKDRAKSNEIIKFTDGLNQLLKELSPSVSDEKRQTIEDYFWMVEEYKVSVFAQELKTAIPISEKRLDKKLKEIGRMV